MSEIRQRKKGEEGVKSAKEEAKPKAGVTAASEEKEEKQRRQKEEMLATRKQLSDAKKSRHLNMQILSNVIFLVVGIMALRMFVADAEAQSQIQYFRDPWGSIGFFQASMKVFKEQILAEINIFTWAKHLLKT